LKKLQVTPRIPLQPLKAKRVALQQPDHFSFKHQARILRAYSACCFQQMISMASP
jgi:hypothetical protein